MTLKGCLSRGREPRVISVSGELACDNHSSTLKVANLDHKVGTESLKVIPFPEPGNWYIGRVGFKGVILIFPHHRGENSNCQSQAYSETLYQRTQDCHGCPANQN